MKRLSIRAKITFWFTAALLLMVLFSYVILLSVSNQILQKTIRDNLIETVENNYNEVRYYPNLDNADQNKDASRFLAFEKGYLEVDSDFLHEVNQVYTALYDEDQTLIYGENPISKITAELAFADSRIQRVKAGGVLYYTFDRKLTGEGLEGLWMRGVVASTQGTSQMNRILQLSLIILPLFFLLASVGGYVVVRHTLKPIREISETAAKIGRENDLKQRIRLKSGKDELHQLADTFNDTFEKLDQAFETQRQFISDASHELRTPMTVIRAQCEAALEQPQTPEAYEKALQVIERQSGKMSRLINGMLDFTRLEAGTEKYQKEVFDFSAMAASIASDMALIKDKGIALSADIQEDISFCGNAELLSRLLINLISNAYRYGREQGHIRVCLQANEQEILLSVADDGIGIAPEDQEKIFGRFYQADPSRSGEGVGLGLAIAAEIVQFHQGSIRVESTPGKGSTFYVTLPSYPLSDLKKP